MQQKDGRKAWKALKAQHFGKYKYQLELKETLGFLSESRWTGQSSFTLDSFVMQHRAAYVTLQECAKHIDFRLPTEYTRVGYLLDGIQYNDSNLMAAKSVILMDEEGLHSNFEAVWDCTAILSLFVHTSYNLRDLLPTNESADVNVLSFFFLLLFDVFL